MSCADAHQHQAKTAIERSDANVQGNEESVHRAVVVARMIMTGRIFRNAVER
jgi:hypothetical protein